MSLVELGSTFRDCCFSGAHILPAVPGVEQFGKLLQADCWRFGFLVTRCNWGGFVRSANWEGSGCEVFGWGWAGVSQFGDEEVLNGVEGFGSDVADWLRGWL